MLLPFYTLLIKLFQLINFKIDYFWNKIVNMTIKSRLDWDLDYPPSTLMAKELQRHATFQILLGQSYQIILHPIKPKQSSTFKLPL